MSAFVAELKHHYGPQVHIAQDPSLSAWLARLCTPECRQPEINDLVERLYAALAQSFASRELPREKITIPTRMTASHPDQKLTTEVIAPRTRIVTVNLARAGTFPSHVCHHMFNQLLDPESCRQDHILASRMTDDREQVTGAHLGSAKIGGEIDGAYVVVPDPMGATGNTIVSALEHYKQRVGGRAAKFAALHLIVTPEYIKRVTEAHPDLIVYALRLDRGLSPAEVLKCVPGERWSEERGLNDKQYIVPGGGGFGEIMNNSWI
ncbi:MAG TPA: uracil phosphoribosyltransferase [Pseudobdellovibrionaceae bacterium]|nr:uracil phosphoribosyltransferase [Pseudobdellovibrionaceae bacterium]